MALNWAPKQNTLARAAEAADIARYGSSRPWIVSGLALSAGTGLNVAISAGTAWIAGYLVEWDEAAEQAVTGSATNHVWIELTRDVNDNVTAVAFVINTTGTPPSGDNVKLGTVTTDGSSVTGTATTGRSPNTQVLVTSVFGRDGAVVAAAGDYDADEVDYDNATSGLTATDVQEALDELAARPTGSIILLAKDGESVAVEANAEYLMEIVCMATNSSSANSYTVTVPAGATATGYVEQIGPIGSSGTTESRGARNVSILTYTRVGTTLASMKAYGFLTVSSTAGNVSLSVTNCDSYSYVKLTKL